ncbi:MAG TPA: hypothetical protein VG078_08945, partial [Acidimicrobiales bacterium]|nr:hypothetical protein [Acidimicrobiales bacterium]
GAARGAGPNGVIDHPTDHATERPTERRRYDIHGAAVEVASADAALLQLLDGRLLPFATADAGSVAAVTFRFLTSPEGPPPRAAADVGRPVYDLRSGHVLYFEDGDVINVEHEGVTMVADLGAGLVETWVGDADHRARWLATHPFFTLAILEVLKRRGLHSVHAAACAADGGSVLLVPGQSGAGKTTLALALARAGLGLLGDDTVFLAERESTLQVLGFPDEVDVTDQTASLLPELSHLLERPKPPGAVKHRLRAEEVYEARLVGSGRPTALVFPEVAGCEDSTLVPMSPDDALMELLPNVLLTEASSSQSHLDALGRLASGVPSYRMTVGTDLHGAATLLATVAST